MSLLSQHYDSMNRKYPKDRMMLVFDIDGTILDMRCMILNLMQTYDADQGTGYFSRLGIEDITVHENQVQHLLVDLGIPLDEQQNLIDWYGEHRWDRENVLHANRPYPGVLEVIKWFKIQPNTLRSLNELGRGYHIQFQDEWLKMNPRGWDQGVAKAKVAGIRQSCDDEFRVIAIFDN